MCQPKKSILNISDLPCLVLKHIFEFIYNGILPSCSYSSLSNVCKKWKVILLRMTTSILLEEDSFNTTPASQIVESMCRISHWFEYFQRYDFGVSNVRKITLRIHLSDRDFRPLCDLLSKHGVNIQLDLGLNDLGDRTAELIAEKLIANKENLESLNLEGNKITDSGLSCIASAMKKNQTITYLNLSKNYFGPEGHADLARAIIDHPTLKTLIVKETYISDSIPEYKKLLMSETSQLETLDISGTNPGAQCKDLLKALCHSRNLKSISLANNHIYPCYILFLTDTIIQESLKDEKHVHIEDVCLANNELGDFGVLEFSKIFKFPYNMKSLSLSNNKFTFCGLSHLCHVLSTSKFTVLERLDLSNNSLSEKATTYLSYLFKNNKTLKEINLSFCGLGGGNIKELSNSLIINKTLTTLKLKSNNIDDSGARAISEFLKANSTLSTLNLSSNLISNMGANDLANSIKINNTLHTIDLSDNRIDMIGALIVIEALKYNETIKDINFALVNIPRNPSLFLKKFPKK